MSEHTASDKKILDELETSREQLLSGSSTPELMRALRRQMLSITRNLYVFRWIPEQTEDLYDVLVDGSTIAHVEISRVTPARDTVVNTCTVAEYRRRHANLTKPERRRLDLALELSRSGKAVGD